LFESSNGPPVKAGSGSIYFTGCFNSEDLSSAGEPIPFSGAHDCLLKRTSLPTESE